MIRSDLVGHWRGIVDAAVRFAQHSNEFLALGESASSAIRHVLEPKAATRVKRAVALDSLLHAPPIRGSDFIDELLVLCSYPDLGGGNRLKAMREIGRIPRSQYSSMLRPNLQELLEADGDAYRHLLPLLDLIGDADALVSVVESATHHSEMEVRELANDYRNLMELVENLPGFASAFGRWGRTSCSLESHQLASVTITGRPESGHRPVDQAWNDLCRVWDEHHKARTRFYQLALEAEDNDAAVVDSLFSSDQVERTSALEFVCDFGLGRRSDILQSLVHLISRHTSYHVPVAAWLRGWEGDSGVQALGGEVNSQAGESDVGQRHLLARFLFSIRQWDLLLSTQLVDDLACR